MHMLLIICVLRIIIHYMVHYIITCRWGIVIRCGVDGKSRTITYLHAGNNNRADTHLAEFLEGVRQFGIPLRTRSDKGGENILIANFMIENRGTDRASHICGRSVHNQR
jgi:hypothetical protein